MTDAVFRPDRPDEPRPGNVRAVLEAVLRTIRDGTPATLAVVIDCAGSTYAKQGAMAFFGAGAQQIGWLSGGCLEPEILLRAAQVASAGAFDVLDIDTRDDEDLFSGSALGCRGRLRILLLPVQQLARGDALIEAWCNGDAALVFLMHADGTLEWRLGARVQAWHLHRLLAGDAAVPCAGVVTLARPPTVLMLGAGPEAPMLLPQLRALGWFVTVVECRERWRAALTLADVALNATPEVVIARAQQFDAALVMHHHFELDRVALQALATTSIPFIGLLGPRRRRDDLFKLLPESARSALQLRLRAPVGLDLGGFGIESIALSIAAQLQAYRHGR